MDIFAPDTNKPAPYILFFHGGLWYSGSRTEINEVCRNVVKFSKNTVGCATADYSYSQDLGGGCNSSSLPTYQKQADQVVAAFDFLTTRPEVDSKKVLLGGHSAGGHLAAWLALNWDQGQSTHPLAFAGVEGIFNVTLWDKYDEDHWKAEFHCATRQAFGDPVTSAQAWEDGSPTSNALKGQQPTSPLLLIHSPGDTWVQEAQATGLFADLKPPTFGRTGHKLDVKGECVAGEHPKVLDGASAKTLAKCMLSFLAAA